MSPDIPLSSGRGVLTILGRKVGRERRRGLRFLSDGGHGEREDETLRGRIMTGKRKRRRCSL